MKVVVDTNCLVASIPPKRPEYWLYQAFANGDFTWVVSTEILLEYDEVLTDFYSAEVAEYVLSILLAAANVELIEPFINWQIIVEDPDDNKFMDVAIVANARYLVSNDRHFKVLEKTPFPKVELLSLPEFQKVMGGTRYWRLVSMENCRG